MGEGGVCGEADERSGEASVAARSSPDLISMTYADAQARADGRSGKKVVETHTRASRARPTRSESRKRPWHATQTRSVRPSCHSARSCTAADLCTGSLLFCPDCGTLLNLPQDGEFDVTCEQCGHVEPASCQSPSLRRPPDIFLTAFFISCTAYENIEIVTRSHPEAFPSALRQKRKTQTKVHAANEDLLKVGYHPSPRPFHASQPFQSFQVTEKCPECGHMEAYSKEAQVRPFRSAWPSVR